MCNVFYYCWCSEKARAFFSCFLFDPPPPWVFWYRPAMIDKIRATYATL